MSRTMLRCQHYGHFLRGLRKVAALWPLESRPQSFSIVSSHQHRPHLLHFRGALGEKLGPAADGDIRAFCLRPSKKDFPGFW